MRTFSLHRYLGHMTSASISPLLDLTWVTNGRTDAWTPQDGIVMGSQGRAWGRREKSDHPSIPVVLNPRDLLHFVWHPRDQCEIGGGIQRDMISEASPSIRQHLRVPDERPVPPPLALDASSGVRAPVPSEDSVQQPQALGVPSVMLSHGADGDSSLWTSGWIPLMV